MKRLIYFFAALTITGAVLAQDCELYMPETEGAELVYNHYGKKGELTSTTKQKVSEVKKSADGIQIKIEIEVKDDKGEEVNKGEMEVMCKDNVFYFDMKKYLDQNQMAGFENMDIRMESENLSMPKGMKAGDKLDDASLTMQILNSGIKIMTMTVKITDRIVEAEESVTTKAGTFKCLKISQVVETKAGMRVTSKTTEWYSKKTGLIKSESYSSKDKLMGSSELVKVN